MPFTVKEHDQPKYNDPNHWNEGYEGLIFPAVTSAQMKCERDDKDIGSRLIVVNILRKIEEAYFILCDLSSSNPNVFFELGWALRGDKPYVLIKDDLTNYTFDLNQQYILDYSHLLKPSILRKEIEKLAKAIEQTVSDQERRYSLTKQISYSLSAIKAAQEDPNTRLLLDIQQSIRDLVRKKDYSKIGKHIPIAELEYIAHGMLKKNEKIEAKVAGSYSIESSFGNHEIVKGFLAATNHRILVVLNAPLQGVRQDYFTYGQITTVSTTSDRSSISLIMPDEVITLFDVIDECDDPEKFFKYITEKKTPPPKTTIMGRDVETLPPLKK